MGAGADLRGMFVMVLPEVREAVGAYGGPGTALPDANHARMYHTGVMQLRTEH